MNNLHISLTEFRNESRVIKETTSILKYHIAQRVYIASLYADNLLEEEKYNDNLLLNRFKLSSRKLSKNLFVQMIKYLEFLVRVTFYYKNKNIKLVNIHAVALLPLGVLLKYLYGAKLVYDTHELETETNGSHGIKKKLSKIIERFLIKKADLVFVVSESIADWYADVYKIRRPSVVLNAPKLFELKKTNYFRDKLGIKKDSIILLYQGGLVKGRGIDLLLETFESRNNDKVVMVFMGYGEFESAIKIATKKKKNIFFHPSVRPEIVLNYTSSADIGISFIENTCLSYYYCMPNKLFEYSMVGLPVLVSNMKEMGDMVEKYEIGIIVKDETVKSIKQAIDKILTLDIDKMKKNARKCAMDNAWEKQEIKMINEYKRVLNAK